MPKYREFKAYALRIEITVEGGYLIFKYLGPQGLFHVSYYEKKSSPCIS